MDVRYAIAAALVIVALYFWFGKKAREPVMYAPLTQELVRALLEALLYRGIEETRLTFSRHDGGTGKVVLNKRIYSQGDVDIRASIDDGFFPATSMRVLVDELDRRGIPYSNAVADRRSGADLVLSFGKDIGQAQFVLNIAFERALGCRLNQDCVAYFNPHLLPLEGTSRAGIQRNQTS